MTCPSRRPRRENARFFEGPSTAEAAGFRECRRCYPKRESTAERLVAETMRLIDGCEEETAPDLSTLAGIDAFWRTQPPVPQIYDDCAWTGNTFSRWRFTLDSWQRCTL